MSTPFPGIPPGIPQTPLRPLDYIANEKLGNSNLAEPPEGTNVDGGLISLINVKSQVAIGELLTVGLDIELEGDNDSRADVSPELVWPNVRAIIKWGIGGISRRAEVDFILGTQLSIMAETVEVAAQYRKRSPPWNLPQDLAAPTFRVSASLGYNQIGRNSNPARLTEIIMIQNPQESQKIQIPRGAISFTMYPDQNNTSSDMFAHQSGFGGFTTSHEVHGPNESGTYSSFTPENTFTIWNGARYLEFFNNGESGPFYGFVIFGLAL